MDLCPWTSASECQSAHERAVAGTNASPVGTGKPSASSKATGKGK